MAASKSTVLLNSWIFFSCTLFAEGATLEAQCSPIYGHFVDHTSRIHHLTNEHLRHSIFFSMMVRGGRVFKKKRLKRKKTFVFLSSGQSSFFKSDTPNRAGFSKYMEAMADKMWDDAVELIKYAGMRGVFMKPEAEGPYNTTGLQFSVPTPIRSMLCLVSGLKLISSRLWVVWSSWDRDLKWMKQTNHFVFLFIKKEYVYKATFGKWG